jgi:hypothetical protein
MSIAIKNIRNNTGKHDVFYYFDNSNELDGIEIKNIQGHIINMRLCILKSF